MTADRRLAAVPPLTLGLAFVGLGLLSLIHRDFAMNWQPFPEGLGQRALWGMASGAVGLVGGLLTLLPRTRSVGTAILALFTALWALALHGPLVAADLSKVASWNGFAEASALAMGALAISRPALSNVALRGFGAACVVFGLAHMVYAEFTAAMVPAWLPMRLEIAWLTGAIHMLTGLVMLAGFRARLAAGVEALMMTSFVVLLHIPRVAEKPADRFEWTMLLIAMALSSAAWALAASRPTRH